MPSRYRWQRAGLAMLGLGGAGALAFALSQDWVGWIQSRYYDIRGVTVAIAGVEATAVPPDTDAEGFAAELAVDGDPDSAWATNWGSTTPTATECGESQGTGGLRLELATPTRVREVRFLAGLAEDDSERPRQFRPQEIDLVTDAGECTRLELQETADLQRISYDSGAEVESVVLTIASTYPPVREAESTDLVSIRAITLQRLPG